MIDVPTLTIAGSIVVAGINAYALIRNSNITITLKEDLAVIKHQTNSMTEQIQQLATAKGIEQGMAREKAIGERIAEKVAAVTEASTTTKIKNGNGHPPVDVKVVDSTPVRVKEPT